MVKVNIELGHLQEKTGIAAQDLAGLRQIAKESGGDFNAWTTGLERMNKAQQQVIEGNEATAKAFTRIGLGVEDVKKADPGAVVSDALAPDGRNGKHGGT
jgi:hypothetical protein